MAFKLGSESRRIRTPENQGKNNIGDTPIIRKSLGEGIKGEANNDGSIYISKDIEPGSAEEREVINHEMRHATDMKVGKLSYGDDFVKYDGVTYERKTINGKDMIKVDGQWKEAGDNFPWEKDANI